jgi:peptidoglycan hydrolase CwlO-like protein
MIKKWSILICLFFACCINNVSAQNGNSREELQKQSQSLQKELEALNNLLEQTKKNMAEIQKGFDLFGKYYQNLWD